ncbi:MAG: RNA methyltransferase [Bacteroidales bacterium]|nr:RNA methyltransferase [Bacteroidales bacterium]
MAEKEAPKKLFTFDDSQIRRQVCDYLKTFLTDERIVRIEEVLAQRTRHFTVVLEDLFQTQNISAVMRSCECYGIQDVYVVEGKYDFQIHEAISMGSNKWLTLHNYKQQEHNMMRCIKDLKAKGFKTVATLPSERSCFLEDLDISQPMAFLFGTELTGLSQEAIDCADIHVKIPMYGFTESFNISNSVAITLSQLVEKLKKSDVPWQLSEEESENLRLEWLQKSLKTPYLIVKDFLEKSQQNCLLSLADEDNEE